MSPRLLFRRSLKPVLYTATFAVTGSVVLTTLRRDKSIDTLSIKPPYRAQDGSLIIPKFPQVKSREENIRDLRSAGRVASSEDIYDLLVIGGGATGTGIALDAATRGLKVALVERDDFSSGTSSKSTKLVHGGVRYLEKAVWNLDYGQYQLVKEALRERKNFLYTAPHLSSWLPVMLPLQNWWQAPYFWAGTKFYDFLAGSEGNPSSYFLTRTKALEAFPMLRRNNLTGALVYYDGQHNDSRMNVSLAVTAALYGATMVNHMEVTSLEKDANGKLCGARVRDLIQNQDQENQEERDFIIRARGIINATGPFSDIIAQMDKPQQREIVAPSEGVHIVLPGYLSPENMGLLDPSTSDGRVMFFLPWQGNIIAGTTDSPCSVTRDPVARENDVNWILNNIRGYLSPEIDLQRSDVLASWSGIRPLVRDPNSKNTESLVRSHLVTVSDSGLLTCAGGKWTTYRQMAEDAVDKAVEVFNLKPRPLRRPFDIGGIGIQGIQDHVKLDGTCKTDRIRLVGAHGYHPMLYIDLVRHFGIDADIAKHLAQNYGDRAWAILQRQDADTSSPSTEPTTARLSPKYPFITAEVHHAVEQEYAQTAIDVLARRTRLSFLDAEAALAALPPVIDLMADKLHWTPSRKQSEWTESVKFLTTMGLPADALEVTREEVVRRQHQRAVRTPRRSSPVVAAGQSSSLEEEIGELPTTTTTAAAAAVVTAGAADYHSP